MQLFTHEHCCQFGLHVGVTQLHAKVVAYLDVDGAVLIFVMFSQQDKLVVMQVTYSVELMFSSGILGFLETMPRID